METGGQKVATLCKLLREETLEPAKQEAEKIIETANSQAERIIRDAEARSQEILVKARRQMEQEKRVMLSALQQAGRQSLEALRQDLEDKLFSTELSRVVDKEAGDTAQVAKLLTAIVSALDKEGTATNLEVLVPKTIDAKAFATTLAQQITAKLKGGTVTIGEFFGGAQVKLLDKKMTIDISDKALKELLTRFVRKDFRKTLFGE